MFEQDEQQLHGSLLRLYVFSFLCFNTTLLNKSLPMLKLPCSVQDARELTVIRPNIYKQEDCILQDSSREKVSRKCNFRKLPNHLQPQHRRTCDTLLMKKVKLPYLYFGLTSYIVTMNHNKK